MKKQLIVNRNQNRSTILQKQILADLTLNFGIHKTWTIPPTNIDRRDAWWKRNVTNETNAAIESNESSTVQGQAEQKGQEQEDEAESGFGDCAEAEILIMDECIHHKGSSRNSALFTGRTRKGHLLPAKNTRREFLTEVFWKKFGPDWKHEMSCDYRKLLIKFPYLNHAVI